MLKTQPDAKDDPETAVRAAIEQKLSGPLLSKAERARLTARLKELYDRQHPNLPVRHFALDVAKTTGRTAPSIERDYRRGAAILDAVLETLTGSDFDVGSDLDQLALLRHQDQVLVADRIAARDLIGARAALANGTAAPVSGALGILPGAMSVIVRRELDRLVGAWDNASPEARQRFWRRIEKRKGRHER